MITSKLSSEILNSLVERGGGLVYQVRGKPTLLQQSLPVARVVVATKMTDEIRYNMNLEKIMYLLVSSDLKFGKEFFPANYFEDAPYEGRPYLYGLFDCYTLCSDWMKKELNIDLPWNYNTSWGWWESETNIFLNEYRNAGFADSKQFKRGCVCFFKFGVTNVPNHVGVYLGENKILHHAGGRFSCVEPFTEILYKKMTSVIEFEGVKKC